MYQNCQKSHQFYFKPNINFLTVWYNLIKLYVDKGTSTTSRAICMSTETRKFYLHCSDCCSIECLRMVMPCLTKGIGHSSSDEWDPQSWVWFPDFNLKLVCIPIFFLNAVPQPHRADRLRTTEANAQLLWKYITITQPKIITRFWYSSSDWSMVSEDVLSHVGPSWMLTIISAFFVGDAEDGVLAYWFILCWTCPNEIMIMIYW